MLGGGVDGFNGQQLAHFETKDKLLAIVLRRLVILICADAKAGNLQLALALVAPEPRNGVIGGRLSGQPPGDGAGVVCGCLHRLQPDRTQAERIGKGGAIAERRNRRIGGLQERVDDNAVQAGERGSFR
ncbi:hypothetical protein D3C87_1708700 [compost metagenome]